MLQKEFFQVQPFNPNPYWDNTIINLSGSQKFEENTVFVPGRYRIQIAPGKSATNLWFNPVLPTNLTLVSNMDYIETINEPFIVRAYCGSNATSNSIGTNPYEGVFKVNGVQQWVYGQVGVDVNHIFGAGGGNSYLTNGFGDSTFLGGPNSLGNGCVCYDGLYGKNLYGGAGSCLHLLPVGGTFGTNYIRAYHTTPQGGNPGSALGGGAGGDTTGGGGGSYWFRGGNSPYGTGGQPGNAGTGIGAGGQKVPLIVGQTTVMVSVGAGAYFNGTTWIDAPGNTTNTGSSYIRVTYLGPLH